MSGARGQDLLVCNRVDLGCRFVHARVRGVHAVDVLGEQHDVRIDFSRTQHGGGVGREIRRTEPAAEDHDATLFQMADGTRTDVRLCHGAHFDGSHHAGGDAGALKGVLQRQRVDRGGKHAHVIGAHAIHVHALSAAPDIARADDDADLDTCLDAFFDDFCNFVNERMVVNSLCVARQCLA